MADTKVSIAITNEEGEIRILEGRGAFVSVFREDATETAVLGVSNGENLLSIMIALMRTYPPQTVMMALIASMEASEGDDYKVIDLTENEPKL